MKKVKLSPWHGEIEQFKSDVMFTDPTLQIDMHWADISTSFHNHNYYEIMLITNGNCSYRHKDGMIYLNKNDLIITTPKEYHQLSPTNSPFKLINLSVTPQLLNNICSSFSPYFIDNINKMCHQPIHVTSFVYKYLIELTKQCTLIYDNKLNYSITLKNWLHCVLTYISNTTEDNARPYPLWFHQLLTELALPETLSLKLMDTALMQKYSATTLNRYFKEYLNTTPNNYFIKLKLDYSTQLLKNTTYTIELIAQKIGFDSQAYFTRLFTKTYGVTPSQYRKQSMT